MKKTYINPNVKVVKINTSKHMLAGSYTMSTKGDYDSGTVTIGSRRKSVWDDDEEEEYQ